MEMNNLTGLRVPDLGIANGVRTAEGNIRMPRHVAHEAGEATEDTLSAWVDNKVCSMTSVRSPEIVDRLMQTIHWKRDGSISG